MITETSNKNELFTAIDEAVSELVRLMSSLDKNKINSVPNKVTWTAAQLLLHVTKSTDGMAKAVRMESKPAVRDPGEKIIRLKKIS